MSDSFIGGPECFGVDVTEFEAAQNWLFDTPVGEDPRAFMSDAERTAFNAHIPHINAHPQQDQTYYLELARDKGLEIADQTAGYDRI